MKKNKLLLIFGLGLMFIPIFGLQAAVATTTTPTMSAEDKVKLEALKASLNRETEILKTNLNTSKTSLDEKFAENKDTIKKKLEIKAQARIRIIVDKIFTKLGVQAGKISLVDSKIALKISDLGKEGVDMEKAKSQYEIAKKALNKANGDILAARIIATEQLVKETSKEIFRTLVKTSEESLKSAASEYQKVLPLLAKKN